MKKQHLIISIALIAAVLIGIFQIKWDYTLEVDSVSDIRAKHLRALENSPFKNTENLNKQERHNFGLPPNRYFEELWELTLDPNTGRPMPERLIKVKEERTKRLASSRGVGDATNPWIDRGPNNEGGRTRAIMFDPTDINNPDPKDDFTRVFAGGVSGGLWVNEDITDAESSWNLVDGMDGSLSVSVLISDPNDNNIFYIGTGESYTSGDAVGSGVWKSTDAGKTWIKIFGGYSGYSSSNVEGIFYINDLVARNNAGVTEVYAAIANAVYRYADSPRQSMGNESNGLYKSMDGGENWSRFNITYGSGIYKNPNDLEVDSENNVWMATTGHINGALGGDIYKSVDGTNFQLVNSIPNAKRTEIEISSNDPQKIWIAANVNNEVDLFKSDDGLSTFSAMNEPNDADTDISADDFTRNQAFFDLVIEADNNDDLIVGGIDLFRSRNDGESWSQISKWANKEGLFTLDVPLVHADQHAIVFRPNSSIEVVFGNDGGVYYSDNILLANSDDDAISERNKNYNTIQFYTGALDTSTDMEQNFAGGTQDNGTQIRLDANDGANSFFDPFGGDGAYTEIDGEDGYLIQSYYFNDHRLINFPEISSSYSISTLKEGDSNNGNFINIAELDKRNDIFYANASVNSNYRIEKVTNFKNGETNIESQFINSPAMNSRPSAMKSSPFSTTTSNLYVGLTTGKLFRVIVDGDTNVWTEITGNEFVGSISDIEFGNNENEIFVTFHNYGVKNIWYTADAGMSWRNIEGNLPDLPVKCILQNPLEPEELIIGTELGIWFTEDYTVNSPSWNPSNNGMNDITVVDLDLRPSDNLVLASTYGRGFFTSNFTSQSLSAKDKATNKFRIFPTVSTGNISIVATQSYDNAEISIYDLSGKLLHKNRLNLSPSFNSLKLKLSTGLYFVNISVDNYLETKRILIDN